MSRKAFWMALAIGILLGSVLLMDGAVDPGALAFALIVAPTLCLVAIFVAILLHELGHLVAGLRAGFDFRSISVGPFEVRREGDRLHWGRAALLRGVGGMVRMLPRNRDELDRRLFHFIVGGPIASLLWTLVTFLLFQTLPPLHSLNSLSAGLGYLVVLSLFAMAVSMNAGTLVPFTTRSGSPTDMKLLLTLKGKPEERGRVVAWFLLAREILGGVRARDWPEDLMLQARLPEDGSDSQTRAEWLLYLHHLDRGDLSQARSWLGKAIPNAERLNKGHLIRECVLLEAAFVAAWVDHDLPEALRWRELAGEENELLKGTRARVDAAIAAREAKPALARVLATEAETHLREFSKRYGGDAEAELELTRAILQSLEK